MTENDKQQRRWHGDWKPEGQRPSMTPEESRRESRRVNANALARALLFHEDMDPSYILAVVTDTFGEDGRVEVLALFERRKARAEARARARESEDTRP
jgi:hypothetical protein